eukprot:m.211760 g.211760  ORF g.211760 m.211760 type:complete len:57 (+) comp33109_c0_seq2:2079-2249(+)
MHGCQQHDASKGCSLKRVEEHGGQMGRFEGSEGKGGVAITFKKIADQQLDVSSYSS